MSVARRRLDPPRGWPPGRDRPRGRSPAPWSFVLLAAACDDSSVVLETQITASPAPLSAHAEARLEFRNAGTEGAAFECRLDQAGFAPCTSPHDVVVNEGAHRFEVRAVLGGEVEASPAAVEWTVDLTPPQTTFTQVPPALDNSVDAEARFTASEESTFLCTLDSSPAEPCGSPFRMEGLEDGTHTLTVEATDLAGNREVAPPTHVWVVDASSPDTRIDAGPSGPTASSTAAFAFSSPNLEDEAAFSCALDGADFAACVSPLEIADLAEGPHTFRARASDLAGNVDPTPALRTWTVDTVAPTVTITSGPSGITRETDVQLDFEVTDDPAFIECRMVPDAFTECQSPFEAIGLAEGDYTFEVQVRDEAGNEGRDARSFTVDTTGPAVLITGGPTGPTRENAPTFTFEVLDADQVECRVDEAPFGACASPFTASPLPDGPHRFEVRATDLGGNTALAGRDFEVDTVAPTVVIESGPAGETRDPAPSFTFRTGGGPTVTECRMDGGAYTACNSPFISAPLADGPHTFEVRVADDAGNEGSDARSFTVDTQAPTVTITSGPSGPTNDATPTFGFQTGGNPAQTLCRIDQAAPVACSASFTAPALADGPHTFEVTVIDVAGNQGAGSRSFTVDTEGPIVTITRGPTGVVSDARPTFEFTVAGGASVVECSLGGGFAGCSSPYRTPVLAEGPYTLTVRARDPAGNVGQDTRSFEVDTTPPTVTITSGPDVATGPTNDSTPTFGFTTAGNPSSTECRVDGGAFTTCASPFTTPSLADGRHELEVRATDAAGNTSADTRSFDIDTQPPTVTITTAPRSPTNDPTPTFTFTTGGNPSVVECRVDGGAFAACTSPFTAASLADGAHTFEVRATDAAGNAATDRETFSVDTTAPTVTITSGPVGSTNIVNPSFGFSVSGGASRIECRTNGGAYAACSSPYSTGQLPDGPHQIAVRAVDAAGNAGVATRAFTIDTVPPSVMITSGPDAQVPTNDPTPTFTFSTTGASGARCRLDGGPYAGCASPFTTAPVADGNHLLEVEAFDAAGNTSVASRLFTVDTVAPTLTIARGPSNPTRDSTPTFGLSATGAVAIECRMDGSAFFACGATYTSPALADGDHLFEARARDAAGNLSPLSAWAFRVDTVAPTLTLTAGPSGLTRDPSPNFRFTTAGSPTLIQCRLSTSSTYGSCSSATAWNLPTLQDGSYVAYFRVEDAAGNARIYSRAFTIDTVAPTITFTALPQSPTYLMSATWRFTVSGSPNLVQCRFYRQGTTLPSYSTCSSTFTGLFSGAGFYNLQVRATDSAGNVRTETRTVEHRILF